MDLTTTNLPVVLRHITQALQTEAVEPCLSNRVVKVPARSAHPPGLPVTGERIKTGRWSSGRCKI